MCRQNCFHNRQSHSRSFAALGPPLAPIELFKDQRQIQRIDSRSVVLHAKLKLIAHPPTAQRDPAPRRRIPRRVLQQMPQDPVQQMRVEPNRTFFLAIGNRHAMPGQRLLHLLNRLFQKRPRRLPLQVHLNNVGIDLRHLYGVADE